MCVVTALWNKIIFFLFYTYQFCLFFHSGEDGPVAWIAMLETDAPMYYDDNWICSRKDRFPLCNGYKAARLVKCSGNNIYKVVCSINKSSLGVPIFTCSSHLYNQVDRTFCDNYSYTLSLKKSTTLANTFLKRINAITKKYWSGTNFFGIDRKDVHRIINDIYNRWIQIKITELKTVIVQKTVAVMIEWIVVITVVCLIDMEISR